MRSIVALFSAVLLVTSAVTRAQDTPVLPGFDIVGSPAPLTASDLTPAATFTVAMKGAFLTPDGIKLGVSPTGGGNFLDGARTGPRRLRAILASSPVSGSVATPEPSPSVPAPSLNGGAGEFAAVPEPGTFLIGLFVGAVAVGARSRRSTVA